jgi:AcrR family transcriptional regulator
MNETAPLPRRPRGRPARNGHDYADTRALLIRRGTEMLTNRGVGATALDDVLKSVTVPKGSFYHYFESKNSFVAATLDAYAEYFARKLDRHFQNEDLSHLARLAAFVDDACHGVQKHDFTRGCLVGNLGQEVNCLDEKLRLRLGRGALRLGTASGRVSFRRCDYRRTVIKHRLPGSGPRFLGRLGGSHIKSPSGAVDRTNAGIFSAFHVRFTASLIFSPINSQTV